MTAQEIIAALEDSNRKILRLRKLPVSPAILELMNQAAMKGYVLGSRVATSMFEGAVAVEAAKLKK